jgi:hypothetical protein
MCTDVTIEARRPRMTTESRRLLDCLTPWSLVTPYALVLLFIKSRKGSYLEEKNWPINFSNIN